MMTLLFWLLLAFISGALPTAVWLGRYGLRVDITDYGDGNPGATNVYRAGGFLWFSLALALEISKAAAPVGLAVQIVGIRGWEAALIALAPVAGHAFSPFLGGRGGKAIAAAFGAWIGLTLWSLPLAGLLLLSLFALLIRPSGWALLLTLLGMLLVILLWLNSTMLLLAWLLQSGLLLWTHRRDLQQRPQLRLTGRGQNSEGRTQT